MEFAQAATMGNYRPHPEAICRGSSFGISAVSEPSSPTPTALQRPSGGAVTLASTHLVKAAAEADGVDILYSFLSRIEELQRDLAEEGEALSAASILGAYRFLTQTPSKCLPAKFLITPRAKGELGISWTSDSTDGLRHSLIFHDRVKCQLITSGKTSDGPKVTSQSVMLDDFVRNLANTG